MRFIYRHQNLLSKILFSFFAVLFSLGLGFNSTGVSAAGAITGSFAPTDIGSTKVVIAGTITNSPAELKTAALKLRLGSGGIFQFESGFISPDADGNIHVVVNNLTPGTDYAFQLFDSAGNLTPSAVFGFKTGEPNPINAVFETQLIQKGIVTTGPNSQSDCLADQANQKVGNDIIKPCYQVKGPTATTVGSTTPQLAPGWYYQWRPKGVEKDGVHIEGQIQNPPPVPPAVYKFKIEYGVNPLNDVNKFEHQTDFLQLDQNGRFMLNIVGLDPSTDYQYRIFDTEGFLAPSQIVDFKTLGLRAIDSNSFVSILGPSSVKIQGQIFAEDQRNLTLYIEYGLKSDNLGSFASKSDPLKLDTAGNFSDVTLSNLQPGTTYQYRVSAAGPVIFDPSPVKEFTTFDASGGPGGSSNTGAQGVPPGSTPSGTGAQGVPPGGSLNGLENPIKFNTLADFVKKILDIVTTIGIPIITIFIIYSGFLFVTARGDTGKLEKAKETFLWTIVGAAIVLASWLLAQAICKTVVELGNTTSQCQ